MDDPSEPVTFGLFVIRGDADHRDLVGIDAEHDHAAGAVGERCNRLEDLAPRLVVRAGQVAFELDALALRLAR